MTDRLILNDQECDMDEKSGIALTSQIEDIASVKDKNISYSYAIKLPPTLKNKNIVQSCEQSSSGSDLPYRKVSAKVIKNGIEVVPYGVGAIIGADENGYEVQVAFGGASFWDNIEGKMLSDLGSVDNSILRINCPATNFNAADYVVIGGSATAGTSVVSIESYTTGQETWGYKRLILGLKDRSATFRFEIHTGQWDASLTDGPQVLQAIIGGQVFDVVKDVEPNTTYVRYFFVNTVDSSAPDLLYGFQSYSTFLGTGQINAVEFLSIVECPALSEMDHAFSLDSAVNSRYNQGGMKYPVIDYGDFDNVTRQIDVRNQRTAVFASAIVEAIIKEAGFIPCGRLLSDPRFKKQIHPFTNDKQKRSKKWIDDHSFRVHIEDNTISAPGSGPVTIDYVGYDDKTSTGYYDPANLVVLGSWAAGSGPPSSIINNIEPAKYKYTVTITFTISGYTIGVSGFSIEMGGFMIYDHSVDGLGNGTFTKTLEVEYERTDITAFPTESLITSAFGCTVAITDSVISGVPKEDVYFGSTWEIAANLDEMTQVEFMKAIMLEYCIVPDIKSFTNEFHLRFFDEIIENKAIAKDWSDKYDVSKKPAVDFIIGDYARRNLMEFTEDSDDTNVIQGYGNGFFLVDNENLKGSKTVAELPFAPTASDNRLLQMMVPLITKINDTGEFSLKTEPRILIDDIQDITGGDLTWTDGTNTFVTNLGIPMCFFAKGSVYDLWFAPFNGASGYGLLKSYWQGRINMLQRAKGLKAQLKITPIDFAGLDHFIPVYIGSEGSIFYINKVPKFIGNNETTEVELIKI